MINLELELYDSVIVKNYGKTIPYPLSEYIVRSLWKPVGNMNLIDLGHSFFLAHFYLEDFKYIISGGPWFINVQYLTTRLWQLDFNSAKETLSNTMAIWARLLGLPLDYYDRAILTRIGNRMGRLLKIDAHTVKSE